MTETELKQAILDYITSWYNADYTGLLTVTVTDGVYKFTIGIPSYMCPTTIAGDFSSDDEFLEFIYKEIRERNYMKVDFYRVERTVTTREE